MEKSHKPTKKGNEKYPQATGQKTFTISVGEKKQSYTIPKGYGYFISPFKKAGNMKDVSSLIEKGLKSKDIQSIVEYLEFKVPEIAKATSVSPSTVSRWDSDSFIGVPGSTQFFKIDEIIRKGVQLFGGEEEFKTWLHNSNYALGNALPSTLLSSPIGIDLVDEALDSLNYGNVM